MALIKQNLNGQKPKTVTPVALLKGRLRILARDILAIAENVHDESEDGKARLVFLFRREADALDSSLDCDVPAYPLNEDEEVWPDEEDGFDIDD